MPEKTPGSPPHLHPLPATASVLEGLTLTSDGITLFINVIVTGQGSRTAGGGISLQKHIQSNRITSNVIQSNIVTRTNL